MRFLLQFDSNINLASLHIYKNYGTIFVYSIINQITFEEVIKWNRKIVKNAEKS